MAACRFGWSMLLVLSAPPSNVDIIDFTDHGVKGALVSVRAFTLVHVSKLPCLPCLRVGQIQTEEGLATTSHRKLGPNKKPPSLSIYIYITITQRLPNSAVDIPRPGPNFPKSTVSKTSVWRQVVAFFHFPSPCTTPARVPLRRFVASPFWRSQHRPTVGGRHTFWRHCQIRGGKDGASGVQLWPLGGAH